MIFALKSYIPPPPSVNRSKTVVDNFNKFLIISFYFMFDWRPDVLLIYILILAG